MNATPVGIDIATNVFQVHYVDLETGEVVNKPIKRAQFLQHFANRARCLIGMEACSGAHHWARQLMRMGHEVRLMPGQFVKAFNIRNKCDAADAKAKTWPEGLIQSSKLKEAYITALAANALWGLG